MHAPASSIADHTQYAALSPRHKAPAGVASRSLGAFLPNIKLAPTYRASVGAVFSERAHSVHADAGDELAELPAHLPALTGCGDDERAVIAGAPGFLGHVGVMRQPGRENSVKHGPSDLGRGFASLSIHPLSLQTVPDMGRSTRGVALQSGAFAQ